MKRILITGAGSYIGTTFESYIKQFDSYSVDTIDMIDGSWREKSFSGYAPESTSFFSGIPRP